MRKHLIWVLGLALALASVGIAYGAANTETITGTISPKKLPKKGKGAPVSLFLEVSATNSGNAFQIPNPVTLAKVDLDKDIKIQQKGLPTCDPTQFTSATTTAQAKTACSDSLVGGGSSKIAVPSATGSPPIEIAAVVTAFNGAGKTLILFTYNTLSGAQTLVGKLGPSTGGAKYGTTLTVPVPPLAGGSAVIQELNTKVSKKYHLHGNKASYVSSTCKDKKLQFQDRFTDNQGNTAGDTFTQKCKQK
ncbi:MAG: hypothetical protein AABM43_11925 [Actinomycetota bacterium]